MTVDPYNKDCDESATSCFASIVETKDIPTSRPTRVRAARSKRTQRAQKVKQNSDKTLMVMLAVAVGLLFVWSMCKSCSKEEIISNASTIGSNNIPSSGFTNKYSAAASIIDAFSTTSATDVMSSTSVTDAFSTTSISDAFSSTSKGFRSI